jgi:hypothetical protein
MYEERIAVFRDAYKIQITALRYGIVQFSTYIQIQQNARRCFPGDIYSNKHRSVELIYPAK